MPHRLEREELPRRLLWSWVERFPLAACALGEITHGLVAFVSDGEKEGHYKARSSCTGGETEALSCNLVEFAPAFPQQRHCLKPLPPPSPGSVLCDVSMQIVPAYKAV